MKIKAEQIPKLSDANFEELQNLMKKLESIPNGPLRDYILDDCFAIINSIFKKLIAEAGINKPSFTQEKRRA